jgi:hypothetical protein
MATTPNEGAAAVEVVGVGVEGEEAEAEVEGEEIEGEEEQQQRETRKLEAVSFCLDARPATATAYIECAAHLLP